MVDTTIHVSDVLVLLGALGTLIAWTGRLLVRAVRSKVHAIETTIQQHSDRIATLEETTEMHEAVLKRLGWSRDRPVFASPKHGESTS